MSNVDAKYVQHVDIIDPDTQNRVKIEIYKLETGALVGLDASFLEQEVDIPFSPYDECAYLNLED